mgnify:CR=1 FL=1
MPPFRSFGGEVLGWRPIQDRDALLARCLHIYGER